MGGWVWWILWSLHRILDSRKIQQQSKGPTRLPFQCSRPPSVLRNVLAFSYPFVVEALVIFLQKRIQLYRNYKINSICLIIQPITADTSKLTTMAGFSKSQKQDEMKRLVNLEGCSKRSRQDCLFEGHLPIEKQEKDISTCGSNREVWGILAWLPCKIEYPALGLENSEPPPIEDALSLDGYFTDPETFINLFKIRCCKNNVHTAKSELCDTEEEVNQLPVKYFIFK